MIEHLRAQTDRLRGSRGAIFPQRAIAFHDGTKVRRLRLTAGTQAMLAGSAVALLGFGGYGVAQAAVAAIAVHDVRPADARVAQMERKVAAMRARVATIGKTARLHADRIEHRQNLLVAALTGEGEAREMALATLSIDPEADRLAGAAIAPLKRVEQTQAGQAAAVRKLAERRLSLAKAEIRRLGLRPDRIVRKASAMGGPLIEANSAEAVADLKADQQFRSLFMTWKKLDNLEQGVIAIPSVQPVQTLQFTSNFGIRSDPFRGTAAMHAGVDIPGPTGTPIYATADGIVSHAGRRGGYGNLVEVNHGKGIATRYGHLSRILVADNTRVTRGQLIGLMGSTGRSTGPHLHYEVRIDGHAVNPVPFLTTADYLLAAKDRSVGMIPVSTGPAPQD